jgi:hypothetical protein
MMTWAKQKIVVSVFVVHFSVRLPAAFFPCHALGESRIFAEYEEVVSVNGKRDRRKLLEHYHERIPIKTNKNASSVVISCQF